MSRKQPDRHNLKIQLSSNQAIYRLINQGRLKPISSADTVAYAIKGINSGSCFCLANDSRIEVMSDVEVKIDGQSISAEIFALPAPSYHAIVKANPFTQYANIDAALTAIQQIDQPGTAAKMIQELVREGRRQDTTPRLATLSKQFSSVWLPEQTIVQIKPIKPERRYPNGPTELIFLTLVFKTTFHNIWRNPYPTAMGIDVGLNPHMVIACENGGIVQFALKPTIPLGQSHQEVGIVERILHYASGRRDSEQAVAYLIGNASIIYSEALTHDGMQRKYIRDSRGRALQDTSFGHLSQYANAAGIRFVRVNARYTSQTCPRCHTVHPANRSRQHFHCVACHYTGNAHEVAARNVLKRGMDPSAKYHCTGKGPG
ncbi:zinc ribbon domain-containing protein [Deinococcus aquaticus]|uniref:zinc ribbon domain-containing protein n=1 Tax=Deinococcus aquaticus TaxID=328692 RepID=UPI003F47A449